MPVSDDRWTCPKCNQTVRVSNASPERRSIIIATLQRDHVCPERGKPA